MLQNNNRDRIVKEEIDRTLTVKREWTDHLLRNVQTELSHNEEKERDRNRNAWISSSSSSGSQGLCFLSAVIK
jgi:hypothetical protein